MIQTNLCEDPVLDPLQTGYHLMTTSTSQDSDAAVSHNYYPVEDQNGYNCTISQQ